MNFVFSTTCFMILIGPLCAQSIPRGVSKASAAVNYNPAKPFRCLDGSDTIPFDQVNDDYCDCKDGSDEPGTAACSNGKFYCMNRGYRPEVIPASRVSDGICDCCDGTDEYENKVECKNTCDELGVAMREERELMRALISEGHRIRSEMSEQGKQAKQEQQALLVKLGPQRDQLQVTRDDLKTRKEAAEEPEKEAKEKHEEEWKKIKEARAAANKLQKCTAIFNMIDGNSDTIVTLAEVQSKQEFDTDNDGTVSEEEAQAMMGDGSPDQLNLDEFCDKSYDLVSPHLTLPTPSRPEPIEEPPHEAAAPSADDSYDDDDEDFEEDDTDEGEDDASKDREVDDEMPAYPSETQALIDAARKIRDEFDGAEKEFNDINTQISDIESLLSMDLGPDDVFYSLKGQCFEYTDREYTYTFCPFDKTSQKPKNGGSETSLGKYTDYIATDDNKYSGMKFEKGQNCWNGPDRSCAVTFVCGKDNVLTSASEPNRCEYAFSFTTPAVCELLSDYEETTSHGHVEL